MNETIPQLLSYDEPSLDAAFATLADEVRTETSSQRDAEAFRLHWLGRKQGRLKQSAKPGSRPLPPKRAS